MGTIMASERSASVWAKAVFAIPVVVVLLIAPEAGASTGAAKLWVTRYNGPANGNDFAFSLAASPDGSRVFVTGLSTGTTGNDYATVAYDTATGARAWVTRYNGPANGNDFAFSLAASPDGSRVFVTGSSLGTAGFFEYATLSYDAASGARLWVRRYNGAGTGGGEASSVVTSPDGSKVFVTGHSVVNTGATVFATVAYSAATGAKLWVGHYSGPGDGGSFPSSLAASQDGSKVFVTGHNIGGVGGDYDYATVAYEAVTGARLWARRYNGPANGTDAAFSVAASPDGSKVFVTGNSLEISGSFDYATLAYDAATGDRLWVKRYNGPGNGNDEAFSVGASPDGSRVFVTGESDGITGLFDYATVAYDAATGAKLWVKRYNGPGNGNDTALSLTADPDGSEVFVTGISSGTTSGGDYATVAYDVTTGARMWVRRYNGPGNGNDEADSVAVNPDGSKVFVTGFSLGTKSGFDYATVSYAA